MMVASEGAARRRLSGGGLLECINKIVLHETAISEDSNTTREYQLMSIYHIHHIVPRHMGGTDDPSNLIELTVEEHADAHLRLWEEYGSEYDLIAYLGLSKMIEHIEVLDRIASESGKKTSKLWADPEFRKKHSEGMKKLWSDPAYRKRQSERSYYNNPSYREKQKEWNKKLWADPELRKKHSDAVKRGMAAKKSSSQPSD